jgi:hypothetical protein
MGQGGKAGGGKGQPKGQKGGDKAGQKGQPKAQKAGKPDKAQKAGKPGKAPKAGVDKGQKSSSFVSICIVLLLCVGSIMMMGMKTVGANPQLMMMSDVRLKKNIEVVNYGIDELMQIEPKSYLYLNETDNTTRHIGVMAQDIQRVMPELVVEFDANKNSSIRNHLPDDILYGVKYQELVPVLINAIKELKQEVDILKAKSNVI